MESIKEIYRLNDELQKALAVESDQYKKVLNQREKVIQQKREGKTLKMTVGELLSELRVTGLEQNGTITPAGKALKKEFPKLYRAATDSAKANKKLHDYVQQEFGFSFRQMSLANYIQITEAVIEMKLKEKGIK